MINIFHHFLGRNITLPSAYFRGKKCLDMIAITNDARIPPKAICRLGIAPHFTTFNTDHRFMYCDLDTRYLFGEIHHDLTRPIFRTFTSNHVQKSSKYVDKLIEHYNKSKVWDRWKRVKYKCGQVPPGEETPPALIDKIKSIETTELDMGDALATKTIGRCQNRQLGQG